MVGWPQNTAPAAGLAGMYVTPPGGVVPFVFIAAVARNPLNPVSGDPRSLTFTIPPALSLIGVGLNFRWFAVTGGTFAEAYPLLVRQ